MSFTPQRILCVEPDDDTAEIVSLVLLRAGYAVVSVPRATAALAMLSRERFDLVLSDYRLPVMSGTSMLHEARTQGLLHGAACLLFTAHLSPEVFDGLEVVQKPLDIDELLRRVASALARGGRNAA